MTSWGGMRARAGRWRRRARGAAASAVEWALSHLPVGERVERLLLRRIWGSGSAEILDAYLVSGYQNPRINLQSVLERHFLLQRLLGDGAHGLMREEVTFAIELNEVLRRRAKDLGVTMASYRDPAKHAGVRRVDAAIADREHDLVARWRDLLAREAPGERISVIELACGSANDYRVFAEAGLARHLDYLGIDLSPKNIANARRRHPEARFEVGDILELRYDDHSFEYVLAADVFEHLSLGAMEHALEQSARLAREGLVLTFFNMADTPDHEVHRRRAYHWNRLSRRRVVDRLRERGFGAIVAVPIARWLERRHGYPHSYNRHAWTIFAERQPRVIPLLPHRLEDEPARP